MLNYTFPILLIVLLGVWARHSPRTPPGFFAAIEWFAFYIAFPALLFASTAQLTFAAGDLQLLVQATLLPTLGMVALLLLGLRLATRLPDPSRSSLIQGSVRPSTYFGLAVATLLFPPDIAALVMLALAICLPLVNVVAVVALAWWGGQSLGAWQVLRKVLENPIILATAAGALVNVLDWPLPLFLLNTLHIVGDAALVLGLMSVGGGLVFNLAQSPPRLLALTATLKLLALPLLTLLLCRWLDASPAVTLAACFYSGLPTAPNGYIMARQMGGDAPLMAAQITLQTLLAMLTVPLLQWVLQAVWPA